MFGEAAGAYVADTNQYIQTAQMQQFSQVSPGEALASGRPSPLQLDAQDQGSMSYMMQSQSTTMWPQTPHSFPPTPAAMQPQMYTGVSQTAYVDVAHATWPQSNPYMPTSQPMPTPAMQQQSLQQGYYQQPQQMPQQRQVPARPNIPPQQQQQQLSWEEERKRQQALAHETRARQQAWASEMQRHHLTSNSSQAATVQLQTAISSVQSGHFSTQQVQPSSASTFIMSSSPVRPHAMTTQPAPVRNEGSQQAGDSKSSAAPIKHSVVGGSGQYRRGGDMRKTEEPKHWQSRGNSDDVQASQPKTPVKSRPSLAIVPSPIAKDSTRLPRGEAWEPPEMTPSPSGQSDKPWRRRGKIAEWALVPVETQDYDWSQDWEEPVQKEKVNQPGPKKIRTRGKFKAEESTPVGSAVSSPAHSSVKGHQRSPKSEDHGRRTSQQDYDDSWYQDSWWYEGYQDTGYYSKGSSASQRKRRGR